MAKGNIGISWTNEAMTASWVARSIPRGAFTGTHGCECIASQSAAKRTATIVTATGLRLLESQHYQHGEQRFARVSYLSAKRVTPLETAPERRNYLGESSSVATYQGTCLDGNKSGYRAVM